MIHQIVYKLANGRSSGASMNLRNLALASITVASMGFSTLAAADTNYLLNLGNSGLAGTGPYATADVAWANLTTATVTFDSLSNGGYLYLMGDGGTVAVNVNAAANGWTFSNVLATNSISGFTPATIVGGLPGNEDGFGSFNQTFNSEKSNGGQGGFTDAFDQVSFTLHNTSGAWANSDQVLAANDSGWSVAIHGFGCKQPCSPTEGAAFTGFATGGVISAIPEPETYAMLLAGLTLLGFGVRRKAGAA